MLKDEQIQFEKYVDKIIKKIKLGELNSAKILRALLAEYLSSGMDRSIQSKIKDDFKMAERLLRIVQSPEGLVIDHVIDLLHVFIDKINPKRSLFFLLSAYFSIYEYYRSHLSEKLLKKLIYKDVWDDYLRRHMDIIFWIMPQTVR